MLESVDLSRPPLSKEEYKPRRDALMEELVVLQQEAVKKGVGLVVLFEGWNGAGKGSRISDLMYNLDARATSVYVTEDLDVKAARSFAGARQGVTGFYPVMQEFWRALGPRGAITFYDRGWYTAATQHLLYTEFGALSLGGPGGGAGKGGKKAGKKAVAAVERARDERHIDLLHRYLTSAADFEQQLVDDGYVVVKFFVHMTKKAQVERLQRLHDDPVTRWRVTEKKLESHHGYETAYELYDRLLERSDYDFAPWVLLNGEDKRRTNLTIASTLVGALERALARKEADDVLKASLAAREKADELLAEERAVEVAAAAEAAGAVPAPAAQPGRGMLAGVALARAEAQAAAAHDLAPKKPRFAIVKNYPQVDTIDHSLALTLDEYKAERKHLQDRLFRLENIMFQRRVPLILMYEGWDAAGKGGNIKRVAQALDARAYTIFPSPAPTKPELAHPFLWRYWTRLPKAGHVGMYDRSWYGRVLVERVEGFATPAEWSRAYDEINEFEHDLVDWGAILLKFWVDVSPEEQLRRFQDREDDPAKQWKITEDDWRNREKYPQYKAAIDDMFRLTSTTFAPWIVLESDDKRYARIKALRIIVEALEKRLGECPAS